MLEFMNYSCEECGAIVEPDNKAKHLKWHDMITRYLNYLDGYDHDGE